MWLRIILTAFALAVVLYLQFGFDIKDWIKHSSATQMSESTPGAPEGETVPSQP